MKLKEYKEKRAKYDPIDWSKCNICKMKFPNDEIVAHIHTKHPERDCTTYNCWTCGIQFKRERAMKRHMQTVRHKLEAKKYMIEEDINPPPEVIVIEETGRPSDDTEQKEESSIETATETANKNPEISQAESQEMEKTTSKTDAKEIEQVVNSLLEALNAENTPTTSAEKEKIMEYYHQDDIVELEIDDWLTIDSYGKTPAIEDIEIPLTFEEL